MTPEPRPFSISYIRELELDIYGGWFTKVDGTCTDNLITPQTETQQLKQLPWKTREPFIRAEPLGPIAKSIIDLYVPERAEPVSHVEIPEAVVDYQLWQAVQEAQYRIFDSSDPEAQYDAILRYIKSQQLKSFQTPPPQFAIPSAEILEVSLYRVRGELNRTEEGFRQPKRRSHRVRRIPYAYRIAIALIIVYFFLALIFSISS